MAVMTVTSLEAAIAYARAGLLVFPAVRGEKRSHKAAAYSNGARWGATRDESEIRADFARWPSANVGIVTGRESGIWVLEADTKVAHGVDGLAALAALPPLPTTRMVESPSGSLHFYFVYPPDTTIRNTASAVGPGIDVRGEGGMVIAPPSIRADGFYRWLNTANVANAPPWLLQRVIEEPRPTRMSDEEHVSVDPAMITAALAVIPNPDVDWENWNRIGMAIYAATEGSDAGFDIFDTWSQKSRKYNARTTRTKWRLYHRSPPTRISAGTLIFLASQAQPGWLAHYDQELIAKLERINRDPAALAELAAFLGRR
jgi:hypothetical protein